MLSCLDKLRTCGGREVHLERAADRVLDVDDHLDVLQVVDGLGVTLAAVRREQDGGALSPYEGDISPAVKSPLL